MKGIGKFARQALGLLSVLLASSAAQGGESKPKKRRVAVRVVELAGGRAYLSPGGKKHVRVGDTVRFGRVKLDVLAINAKNVVVAVGKARLRRGQRGFIRVDVRQPELARPRSSQRSLASFAGAWPVARRPADAQHPKPVPLGSMRDARRNRAVISLDHFRILPLGGAEAIGRTRLRARLHVQPWGPAIHLDVDGQLEGWQAADLDQRRGNASRPLLRFRQLELGYRGETLRGSAGRLRYASSALGMLDGARVTGTLAEGLSVSAFGGFVPMPTDSSLATNATRFGTELAWSDPSARSSSRALLSLSGSSYEGRLDERRATASFQTYPDWGNLAARAEVSLFDRDNPWGASTAELTAAGLDVGLAWESLRLGASADLYKPERSRYLAALLPSGYFCVAQPQAGTTADETCLGGDQRRSASARVAWDAELWNLSAGVSGTTTTRATAEQIAGHISARHRQIWGPLRADAGLSGWTGSLLESAGLQLGAGGPLLTPDADLSVYYRPRLTRYRADGGTFLEQSVGVRLWWAPAQDVDLSLSADGLFGRDVDVAYLHASLAWRPRF